MTPWLHGFPAIEHNRANAGAPEFIRGEESGRPVTNDQHWACIRRARFDRKRRTENAFALGLEVQQQVKTNARTPCVDRTLQDSIRAGFARVSEARKFFAQYRIVLGKTLRFVDSDFDLKFACIRAGRLR